jgi:hypothetical protein
VFELIKQRQGNKRDLWSHSIVFADPNISPKREERNQERSTEIVTIQRTSNEAVPSNASYFLGPDFLNEF